MSGTNQERRAPVQADREHGKPAGSVSWAEHEEAWRTYDKTYRCGQSAERIAERSGFSYGELVDFLGHDPETWEPRR